MNVRNLKKFNFSTFTRVNHRFQTFLRLPRFAFIVFCITVLVPSLLSAQNSAVSAAFTGTIRDAAGASVPGSAVRLRNIATNQERSTTSDNEGGFRFPVLPVGDYEIWVEATNFAPYVNPNVTLAIGRTTLDITLQAAGISESVVVKDEPPALDTSQTASTTSIDPERIEELPVNSRNYLEFTLLAPGVAPSNGQTSGGASSAGNSSGAPLADSGFTFGGLRPRSNSISIDGLDNTDETTGAARVALSPEIVREFQVVNNGLSAEFGGAAGGAINVVTKTGTNEFHGDLFTFFQNERFNARDPSAGGEGLAHPRFRRYQPGGSLGGQILRDKLFFYAALEQENLTAQEHAEISPVVRGRIDLALTPTLANTLGFRAVNNNLFAVGTDETEAAGKLTYLANPTNTFDFRFAFTNLRSRGNAFNTDILSDPTARGSSYTKDYLLTGAVVSVLSPQFINDFRAQISTRRAITRSGGGNFPGIEIVGAARFNSSYEADATRSETREQFLDTLTLFRGNHEWKTGVAANHVGLSNNAREGFNGLYIFRTVEDFAAGRPSVWRQSFGDSPTRFSVTSFGTFAQDRWRIFPKLTFDLGLRYDLERLPPPFRTDKNNFSPRIGAAWSPTNKWVVRAGFGIFYDRLPLAYLNRAIQKNGSQAFEQVAVDENAAQAFRLNGGGRASLPLAGIAPSIFRADRKFSTPYSLQVHAGFERLLTKDVTFRTDYLFTRGIHLPRTRNINLLPPVVLTAANAAALGFPAPTA